jgi:RNAse (barnase) inhibitor barstar
MYAETMTALLSLFNQVEVNGNTGFAQKCHRSNKIAVDTPKTKEEINRPKITIEFLGTNRNPIRDTGEEYYDLDTTSSEEYYESVPMPKPKILMVQVELFAKKESYMDQMKEWIEYNIDVGKDVDITWNIVGYDITLPCHLHKINDMDRSDYDNQYDGNVVYTFTIESFVWSKIDAVQVPLIRERLIRRATDDDKPLDYTLNLDNNE